MQYSARVITTIGFGLCSKVVLQQSLGKRGLALTLTRSHLPCLYTARLRPTTAPQPVNLHVVSTQTTKSVVLRLNRGSLVSTPSTIVVRRLFFLSTVSVLFFSSLLAFFRPLTTVDIVSTPCFFLWIKRVQTLAVFQLPCVARHQQQRTTAAAAAFLCNSDWSGHSRRFSERPSTVVYLLSTPPKWRVSNHSLDVDPFLHDSPPPVPLSERSFCGRAPGINPRLACLKTLHSRRKTKAPVEPTPTLLQPDGRTRLSGDTFH